MTREEAEAELKELNEERAKQLKRRKRVGRSLDARRWELMQFLSTDGISMDCSVPHNVCPHCKED